MHQLELAKNKLLQLKLRVSRQENIDEQTRVNFMGRAILLDVVCHECGILAIFARQIKIYL